MSIYICPTPIGNLEDITLRVLRVLREVDCIAAEDTRRTRKLINHYQIHTPLVSYHEHNKEIKGDHILAMCMEGKDIALVSDAGTPGISDPGWELIRDAIEAGIEVICLPGPTALISALLLSGFQTASFIFDGFLPRKKSDRRKHLEELVNEGRTIIFYEAPHRLIGTLSDILEVIGERRICIVRELTKIHEEVFRGIVSQAVKRFSMDPVRGEIVILLEGAPKPPDEEIIIQDADILQRVNDSMKNGMSTRDAIKEVAQHFNISRRHVYNLYHENN